jgi:hypothetical protein
MLDEQELIKALQARVDEITATMGDADMQPMVRLLQSTRARALMDVIECIKSVDTAEKSQGSQADSS